MGAKQTVSKMSLGEKTITKANRQWVLRLSFSFPLPFSSFLLLFELSVVSYAPARPLGRFCLTSLPIGWKQNQRSALLH